MIPIVVDVTSRCEKVDHETDSLYFNPEWTLDIFYKTFAISCNLTGPTGDAIGLSAVCLEAG